jgi:hypothetical protein
MRRSLIRGDDRFLGRRALVVTGERAEESPSRARYASFEPHRTDTQAGTRRQRHVDHWRPVHRWREREVWEAVRRVGAACWLPAWMGTAVLHLHERRPGSLDPLHGAGCFCRPRELRTRVWLHHRTRHATRRATVPEFVETGLEH